MAQDKPKKEFLWVNKDAEAASLSSSNREEKLRIFSFVQNQRLRTVNQGKETSGRRQPAPERRTTDPGPVVQPESGGIRRYRPLSIRPTRNVQPLTSAPVQLPAHTNPRPPTQNALRTISRRSSSRLSSESSGPRRSRTNQAIPNVNHIPGSAVDPFSAAPMPMTKNIQVLIRYFLTMVSTGSHVDKTEVLPAHLQPARRFAKVRDVSLQAVMHDRVEFTSLMVIMSSRMVHLSRIPLTGLARPEYYMHLALAAVRERMLDFQARGVPGDNVLVHGIHSLALADWICQRYDAAAMHVRAVKMLLPLLNLDDALDLHIAQGIFNIDKMIAIETGWLPEFPLMFDPGPMDEARMSLIRDEVEAYSTGRLAPVIYPHSPVPDASKLSNAIMGHQIDILADASATLHFSLGTGFEHALAADTIHDILEPVLSDLLDALVVAKYVWSTPNATREDAEWMCKCARTICYRLLALPAELPPAHVSAQAAKTEALRIALLLVVLRCTNRMSFRSAQPNMRRLQCVLSLYGIDTKWSTGTASEDSPSDPYDENELLLWVLMTGLFSADNEPEELWFLIRATYVAERHLGIKNLDDLKAFMDRYLYSSTRQERSLIVVSLHLSG